MVRSMATLTQAQDQGEDMKTEWGVRWLNDGTVSSFDGTGLRFTEATARARVARSVREGPRLVTRTVTEWVEPTDGPQSTTTDGSKKRMRT